MVPIDCKLLVKHVVIIARRGNYSIAQGRSATKETLARARTALGVRIPHYSGALTGQLHKCIEFQSICRTQMLNIFYVVALSGRKGSGVVHQTQGVTLG